VKPLVIEFPEVRYDYDKADLQVIPGVINSLDSLDYLYYVLISNPNIAIELQAHTDCRGSDSYNLKLSQRRAEACIKYLLDKGIPKIV
jgi:outer membrane protein OmpA-like peptidoglycan-associated protein